MCMPVDILLSPFSRRKDGEAGGQVAGNCVSSWSGGWIIMTLLPLLLNAAVCKEFLNGLMEQGLKVAGGVPDWGFFGPGGCCGHPPSRSFGPVCPEASLTIPDSIVSKIDIFCHFWHFLSLLRIMNVLPPPITFPYFHNSLIYKEFSKGKCPQYWHRICCR